MKQCEQERIRKSENVQQFNVSDPDDLVNIFGVNNRCLELDQQNSFTKFRSSSSPPPDDLKSGEVSSSTERFWSFTVKQQKCFVDYETLVNRREEVMTGFYFLVALLL